MADIQAIEVSAAELTDDDIVLMAQWFSMVGRRDETLSMAAAMFHMDVAAQLRDVLNWRNGMLDKMQAELADPTDPNEASRGWQLPQRSGLGWF
jgi:hypothetical protein